MSNRPRSRLSVAALCAITGLFPLTTFAQQPQANAQVVTPVNCMSAGIGCATFGSALNPLTPRPVPAPTKRAGSQAGSQTSTSGLIITPVFDPSILHNPNSATIINAINNVCQLYHTLFSDPITVQIYFSYSTLFPDGSGIPVGFAASLDGRYTENYFTFVEQLQADATSGSDSQAVSHLNLVQIPSSIVNLSSANGRALGFATPGYITVPGDPNPGTQYDGIVALSPGNPWQFDRTNGIASGNYDAQAALEHEVDEVLGLGSIIPNNPNAFFNPSAAIRPEDLFRYVFGGTPTLTVTRVKQANVYFSIDGGFTDIVSFNQQAGAIGVSDYGDWATTGTAGNQQVCLYVQDASSCLSGVIQDISSISPEGVALDVIGYNLNPSPVLTSPADKTTGVSRTPTLTWNAVPLSTSYTVSFGTSSPPPVVGVTSDPSYSPGTLSPGTVYYWSVTAGNHYTITSSATLSFTTQFVVPDAPILSAPSNGATGQSPSPTLVWQSVAGATSYDVYFGTTSSPPFIGNTAISSYTPGNLSGNTKYYWRVVAKNVAGSTTSATWSFTTAVITTAPDLVITLLTAPTSATAGAAINVAVTIANQGNAPAGAFKVEYYFAVTNAVTANAIDSTWSCSFAGVAIGASVNCAGPITVPANLASATWYFAAIADPANQLIELSKANNSRVSDSGPIAIMGPPPNGAVSHFAAGGIWTTGFFVLNTGNSTAQFSIAFQDDNGNPIQLPFSTGAASTLAGTIPAQGSAYYEVANPQLPAVGGSGKITADPSIVVQALFRENSNGTFYEAAVPSNSGSKEFLLPFDATTFAANGQPFYTGIAIANLDASIANVACTARDANGAIIPGAISVPALPPLGHWANYLFPALTGKRGTIDCTSNTNVAATALRFIGTTAFSSLPVIANPSSFVGPPSSAQSHFAAGGIWTTGFFVVNTGNASAQFSIAFHGDDGSALVLPFSTGAASTLSGVVPAHGSAYYEAANPQVPAVGGWGQISADPSIVVQSLFREDSSGTYYEAAVPSSSGSKEFLLPFDATTFDANGQPFYTGIAIANLDSATANVTCTARDPGGVIIPAAVSVPPIPPLGHWADYLFPALTGRRGSIDCVSNTNVASTALRFIGTTAFSSLPVIMK